MGSGLASLPSGFAPETDAAAPDTSTASGGATSAGGEDAGPLDAAADDARAEDAGFSASSAISAGGSHTCAVTASGGALCWGLNFDGQLGDGSHEDSPAPVAVAGLASGVSAIASGGAHSCALTTAGAALCWGWNANGQLGDGSVTDSASAVKVSGLGSAPIAIAAGGAHSCALLHGGAVQCWGFNAYGQLGDGSTTDSAVPVSVVGLGAGVVALAAGNAHTCALTGAGAVQCWGYGYYGQLGDGAETQDSVSPVAVKGLAAPATAIAHGGTHSGAVVAGDVWCWGNNQVGQLGNASCASTDVSENSCVDSPVAVQVVGLDGGVTAITAGEAHTCAIAGGSAFCWGWNIDGQLGNGVTADSPVPVAVSHLGAGARAISAGDLQTCAIVAGGAVACWGGDVDGQLGNGSSVGTAVPGAVTGL